MKNRKDKAAKALAALPNDRTYDVGYGKPPEHSRFKPGKSGNPKGRPKGSKNKVSALNEERLKSIILEEAYRSIRVNDGNKPVSVPMAQAIIRSVAVNAAKGNQRAQRLFTELLTTTERENSELHRQWLDTAIIYKVEWEKELARRERLGIEGPEPLPHPDHVIIDVRRGTAHVKGPMTKEEKAEWEEIKRIKTMCDESLPSMYKELYKATDPEEITSIQKDIAEVEEIQYAINAVGLDE